MHQHCESEDIMRSSMLHCGLWSRISLWEAAQDTKHVKVVRNDHSGKLHKNGLRAVEFYGDELVAPVHYSATITLQQSN